MRRLLIERRPSRAASWQLSGAEELPASQPADGQTDRQLANWQTGKPANRPDKLSVRNGRISETDTREQGALRQAESGGKCSATDLAASFMALEGGSRPMFSQWARRLSARCSSLKPKASSIDCQLSTRSRRLRLMYSSEQTNFKRPTAAGPNIAGRASQPGSLGKLAQVALIRHLPLNHAPARTTPPASYRRSPFCRRTGSSSSS